MPNMRFNYFRVEMGDGEPDFEDLLGLAAAVPRGRDRTIRRESQGDAIHLLEAEPQGKQWLGDMLRIRMEDLPQKASLAGEIEDLDLADNEGIGERAAWLYDTKSRVLVTQSTRVGTSPVVFMWYIANRAKYGNAIPLEPLLKEDALSKLAAMDRVRKVSIRSSALSRLLGDSAGATSVHEALDLQRKMTAPVMEITLSMGYEKGQLGRHAISMAKTMSRFFHQNQGPNDHVQVTGYTADGERDVLDLMHAKLHSDVLVRPGHGRKPNWQERQAALTAAWRARADFIRSHYGG